MVVLSDLPAGRPAAVSGAASLRGMVDDLRPPRLIAREMPAALQEDEFCMRLVSAFDDVMAPLYCTLDCFDSYLDPQLAPEDFAEWLASWVGVEADETWDPGRRRKLIEEAVPLYRIRGTAAGLATHIRLYADVTPEIEESGGCAWSQTSGAAMPGSPQPHLTVRLHVEDHAAVKHGTVNRIVASSRPAHLPYHVEILVGDDEVAAPEEAPGSAEADASAPGAVALPGSESIRLAPQAPPTAEEHEEQEQKEKQIEAGPDVGSDDANG